MEGCGKCDYKGNSGDHDDGVLVASRKAVDGGGKDGKGYSMRQITDGTSNTFLVGEASYYTRVFQDLENPAVPGFSDTRFPVWVGAVTSDENSLAETNCSAPMNVRVEDDSFYSEHNGIVQFVYVDGSVHSISEDIDIGAYVILGVRNDGYSDVGIDCSLVTSDDQLGGG
jgi:hypothetical protein